MAERGTSKWYNKILPYLTTAEHDAKSLKTYTDELLVFQKYFGPNVIRTPPGDTIYMHKLSDKTKKILEFLQYFCHFNYKFKAAKFNMLVLGKDITFKLTESTKGRGNSERRAYQIFISFMNNSGSYTDITKYSGILPQLKGLSKVNQKILAQVILDYLKSPPPSQQKLPKEVEDVMEHAARLVLITHICESAVPLYDDLKVYRKIVEEYKDKKEKNEIPNINDKPAFDKTGRIPMADKITRAKLRKIANGQSSFQKEFDEDKFPIIKPGGTADGRHWVLQGKCLEELSDDDDELAQQLASTNI